MRNVLLCLPLISLPIMCQFPTVSFFVVKYYTIGFFDGQAKIFIFFPSLSANETLPLTVESLPQTRSQLNYLGRDNMNEDKQ